MSYVVLQPHSNTNPTPAHRVAWNADVMRAMELGLSVVGADFFTAEGAQAACDRLNSTTAPADMAIGCRVYVAKGFAEGTVSQVRDVSETYDKGQHMGWCVLLDVPGGERWLPITVCEPFTD